jgi:low temperature requirement protein LtrA
MLFPIIYVRCFRAERGDTEHQQSTAGRIQMSEHSGEPIKTRAWMTPMRARSKHEQHRASTPLELLFDLVFVIAVSQNASALHHGIAEGHVAEAILGFTTLFFAIWWAWMNFTWFASAYDTDDVPYRLAVFVQLSGALIIAAGVQQAFVGQFGTVTIGYLVMRLAGVVQWLRAARSDPAHRATAYRYAIGISIVQALWIARLALPQSWQLATFVTLMIADMAVPIWAERTNMTSWHAEHIAERYGLFTIIVLGESLLSGSLAIQSAMQTGDLTGELSTTIIGGLLIVFSMWWLYFDQPAHELLTSLRTAFIWGYGQLFVFASAAAVGAGLAVVVDYTTHHADIGAIGAGAAVAIPSALYLLSLWALHERPRSSGWVEASLAPICVLLILLTPLTGQPVLLTGLLFSALLAIKLVVRQRSTKGHQRAPRSA